MKRENLEQKRIEDYSRIKTPEELLKFMDKNIQYGLKDENDRIYTWDMNEFQEACEKKWKFKSGIDIVKLGYGHCWDQAEIERYWFKKHNFEFKTLFIFFDTDIAPFVCHTYLVYKDKKSETWNWFEHADEANKGIHRMNTLEDAILAQREASIKFNQSIGLPINDDTIRTIRIYEYNPPKIGCSNQEFLDNIFEHGKDITPVITNYKKR